MELLDLKPATSSHADESKITRSPGSFGAGESEAHKKLKKLIAEHPEVIGLPKSVGPGEVEHVFPSADAADVLFKRKSEWVVAEVKPANATDVDIERGIFQCVKYVALMEAVQKRDGIVSSARAILVLGGALPQTLKVLVNTLGIPVSERIAADC